MGVTYSTPGGELSNSPGAVDSYPLTKVAPGGDTSTPLASYAESLRASLEAKDWSQGRLIKELAARTGNNVESEKSAVRSYLKDARPNPERARILAELLENEDLAKVPGRRETTAAQIEAHLAGLEDRLDHAFEAVYAGQRQIRADLEAIQATLDERLPEQQARRDRTSSQ